VPIIEFVDTSSHHPAFGERSLVHPVALRKGGPRRRETSFRKPHCGSIRIDETYIKVRGQWRYLYRAIDKHGTPVDFLLTAKRDLEAAKRFFRKMLKNKPLLAPDRIGTDGAGPYPPAIAAARKEGFLPKDPLHYVTKHLQQGIESDLKGAYSRSRVRSRGSWELPGCGFGSKV
jgi:transposase-like protein